MITLAWMETRARLARRGRDLSWSKLQQFERCPGHFFAENFAAFADRTTQAQDHRHAFPGTILQRVWEAVINERIHHRPGLDDDDALAAWCARQAEILFALVVMPVARQYERPQEDWRGYFASAEGQAVVSRFVAEEGLDPVFATHLQPQFVDASAICRLHGSVASCLRRLGSLFRPMIAAWRAFGLSLDAMVAERWLSAGHGAFRLAGQADFIARGGRDGYVLLDGKYRLGAGVEAGQLYFYALMIEREEGVRPGWLGFVDYGRACMVPAAGDGAYDADQAARLLDRIDAFTRGIERLLAQADKIGPSAELDWDELDLALTPGIRNCAFCTVRARCARAILRHERTMDEL